MLPKAGKSGRDPNNYRPISLLPTLGKLLERIVLVRLNSFLTTANVIRPEQFGFRKHRSAAAQTLRLAMEAMSAIKLKHSLPTAFFDRSFAFDKVNHNILLTKLHPYIPTNFYALLSSYLQNHQLRLNYNNNMSSLRKIRGGVPKEQSLP